LPTPEPSPKSSSRRVWILYGTIGVVVLGLAAGLILLLQGNNGSPSPTESAAPISVPPVGNFSFNVGHVTVVPTGKTAGTQAAGNAAAKNIGRTLDGLYFTGFLNPSAWQSGNYDAAWKLFANEAQAKARKDESTLTLGPDAGSKFSSTAAGLHNAYVKVLMDKAGQPATAVVTVSFTVKGTGKDGTTTNIKSTGEYFLVPRPGGWAITGYAVKQGSA
jgi:hypothetical protein